MKGWYLKGRIRIIHATNRTTCPTNTGNWRKCSYHGTIADFDFTCGEERQRQTNMGLDRKYEFVLSYPQFSDDLMIPTKKKSVKHFSIVMLSFILGGC